MSYYFNSSCYESWLRHELNMFWSNLRGFQLQEYKRLSPNDLSICSNVRFSDSLYRELSATGREQDFKMLYKLGTF